MGGIVRFILYGVGVWAITLVAGMLLFPVVDPATPLFDTLMSVAMSLSAGGLSYLYLRGLARPGPQDGVIAGLIWAALAVALDAPLFLFGPFLMPVADYVADIGLTYLMIPAIAGFVGLAMRRAG